MSHSAAVSVPNVPVRTVVGFGPGSLTRVCGAGVALHLRTNNNRLDVRSCRPRPWPPPWARCARKATRHHKTHPVSPSLWARILLPCGHKVLERSPLLLTVPPADRLPQLPHRQVQPRRLLHQRLQGQQLAPLHHHRLPQQRGAQAASAPLAARLQRKATSQPRANRSERLRNNSAGSSSCSSASRKRLAAHSTAHRRALLKAKPRPCPKPSVVLCKRLRRQPKRRKRSVSIENMPLGAAPTTASQHCLCFLLFLLLSLSAGTRKGRGVEPQYDGTTLQWGWRPFGGGCGCLRRAAH